jgi:myo-inositol-1-phosphate synthase
LILLRLALFGFGNSAKAVVKALELLRKGEDIGIWHGKVGGYDAEEVEVVCAFDIDRTKIGSNDGLEVFPGIANDEVPAHLKRDDIKSSDENEILDILRKYQADIAFNLVSSGQDNSSIAYAKICSKAGVAFANGTSAEIANNSGIRELFQKTELPIAGDDLMSQLGGTVLHRGLVDFLASRGIKVSRSYQLDVGGSTDTLNTISEEVRAAKRKIKSQSIASELEGEMETVAGTTDFVDFLGSKRTVYLWLECLAPLNERYTLDVFYKSSDPANAINIVLDVSRALMSDKKERKAGISYTVSAYGFKNPPKPVKAREALERFEAEYVNK